MFRSFAARPKRRLATSISLAALIAGAVVLSAPAAGAQEAIATSSAGQANGPAAVPPPSDSLAVNIVRRMVAKGLLTQSDADELIAGAQADTARARSLASAAPAGPPAEPGDVRAVFVPENVREDIKAELRKEVVQQAKAENWAAPNTFPDWVSRVTLFGDLRVRDEQRNFDEGNYFAFVNVGAINAGAPYNTGSNNTTLPPILNSRQDRNLARLRARLGLRAKVNDELTAVMRLATGSDSSPVSTNQTLGGFFAKKGVYLDQAYLDYRASWAPGLEAFAGRMPNPFVRTDLMWDDDINLDGLAASYLHGDGALKFRVAVGAFPLDYIPDDFPTNATADEKVGDHAKWLWAAQAGAEFAPADSLALSLHAAYYDFTDVQGDLSPSCSNLAAYCLTDFTRPGFLQKGNTVFALRNFNFPDPGNVSQPQYYGLASKFQILDLVAKADYRLNDRVHVTLTADYARNLGYDRAGIQALPIANNNETCSVAVPAGGACPVGANVFKSGDTAWHAQLAVGAPTISERGDWNLMFGYRRIEPDALLDAFTDSDFHLGGTNAKGFVVGANFGIARNTTLGARWLSADEVVGPTFAADVFQLDLSAKY